MAVSIGSGGVGVIKGFPAWSMCEGGWEGFRAGMCCEIWDVCYVSIALAHWLVKHPMHVFHCSIECGERW